MSRSRMTTLPFLLLALSPFDIFDSDYALISCLLCKLNTLGTGGDDVSHTRMTIKQIALKFQLFMK